MARKIVLFNGPPGSGKDEAAHSAAHAYDGRVLSFKNKLFDIALTVSGIPEQDWFEIYDAPRDSGLNKNTPLSTLGGLSQREFLIKISEEWVKPTLGEAYFGYALAEAIAGVENDFIFVSDSGFEAESRVLQETFGYENVVLVRLEREGCTYEGDSRGYLDPDGFHKAAILYNNGSLVDLRLGAIFLVTSVVTEEV